MLDTQYAAITLFIYANTEATRFQRHMPTLARLRHGRGRQRQIEDARRHYCRSATMAATMRRLPPRLRLSPSRACRFVDTPEPSHSRHAPRRRRRSTTISLLLPLRRH